MYFLSHVTLNQKIIFLDFTVSFFSSCIQFFLCGMVQYSCAVCYLLTFTSFTPITWVSDPCSTLFWSIPNRPVNTGWFLVITIQIWPGSDAYQYPHMLEMGGGYTTYLVNSFLYLNALLYSRLVAASSAREERESVAELWMREKIYIFWLF